MAESAVTPYNINGKRTRRTALITGGSSGLGAAFGRVFAKQGFDVALAARRMERLEQVAADIEDKYKVKTYCVDADLAAADGARSIYDRLQEQDVHIDALVNNAGVAIPGFYQETPWDQHRDLLQIMVTSPSELAYLFEPGMVRRGYGRIINVSSFAGLVMPTGSYTLYCAAKSFLVKFSQAHAGELKGTGVQVLALCPGFFKSDLHDESDDSIITNNLPRRMFLNVDKVAQEGYDAVMKGEDVIYVNGRIYKIMLKNLESQGLSKVHGKGQTMSYADRLRQKLNAGGERRRALAE